MVGVEGLGYVPSDSMDVQTLAQDECSSCGTEIDFHFDKERGAYEKAGWHDILSWTIGFYRLQGMWSVLS
jgi:hypothetical protein